MYISTDKPMPMDVLTTQTQLKELLLSLDKNPDIDKGRVRIILSQWKDVLQKLGGTDEEKLKQIEIIKSIEDKIGVGRRTWEPTTYEYIVFYIVIAFIILVFGKTMPKL